MSHAIDCKMGRHTWWAAGGERRPTCTWCALTIWAYAEELEREVEDLRAELAEDYTE